MKKYTIGALFSHDLTEVLLINKLRPKWQAGKLNLPGGHIEEGENSFQCVSREFEEEAGIKIPAIDWHLIGKIENKGNYFVDFLSAIMPKGREFKGESLTDEKITWVQVKNLPENCISNLSWLVPFALNYWEQGNADCIKFGLFSYEN